MKIEKVRIIYMTSIPIAPYGIKDTAGAEIEVHLGEGESFDFHALHSALKKEVDESVHKQYPHIYGQEKTFVSALAASIKNIGNPYPAPSDLGYEPVGLEKLVRHNPDNETVEGKPLLQLIQESKTISELRSWELLIKVEKGIIAKQKLYEAYDEMFEKLKEKEKA